MTAARSLLLRFVAVALAHVFGLACAQAGSLQHDLFARPVLGDAQPSRPEPGRAAKSADHAPAWNPALKAVAVAGRDSLVNVDGAIVRIGGEIDGFRLVEVREREAVFVKDKKRYTLTLGSIKGPDAVRESRAIGTDKVLNAAPDAQTPGAVKGPDTAREPQAISTDKGLDAAPDSLTTGNVKGSDTIRRPQ